MERLSLLAASITFLFAAGSGRGEDAEAPEPIPPRYELRLTTEEYTVMQAAAQAGVGRYGGLADFRVQIQKNGERLQWLVTINDPKLPEVWGFWLAEKTTELVGMVNLDKLDEDSKAVLRALQTANVKLAKSRQSPIWDPTVLSGTVARRDGRLHIEGPEGSLAVSAAQTASYEGWVGRAVAATGLVKTKGEIEITRLLERKARTLELCVMSHCPFAKKAEAAIIRALRSAASDALTGDTTPPRLEVRYLFIKADDAGKTAYVSLHGPAEVEEDVVQMAIRDHFPERVFQDYLLRRSESEAPWRTLAAQAGLNADAIAFIDQTVKRDGAAMIAQEQEYVGGQLGVEDRSPSLVWESRIVPDLKKIKPLASVDLSGGACGGK